MNKVLKILKKPSLLFLTLAHRGFFKKMDDEKFLSIAYRITMGKRINLKNPRSYNEKLQWLKINDKNPQYTSLVDKSLVKEYVASLIGKEHVIPTLGIWNHFDEIDFDSLPNQFVLKCTHDSGGLVICKDKSSFNKKKAKRVIEACLKHNYFWGSREWPYKNVKPRIIAEEYMVDSSGDGLRDYKFFTFNGEVKWLFVASDRQKKNSETKFDFFDSQFNHLNIKNGHPNSLEPVKKPICFEEMKRIASILSKNTKHLRVDLYEINGNVYFGELTFYHWSGFVPFEPEEWDYKFGDALKLPIESE